ncbi:hypothetical protein AHF37_11227 [Paragonimus kellicotti]|nr:hypothetical protein AHF37_11227 [Paragonimus kellicotti]
MVLDNNLSHANIHVNKRDALSESMTVSANQPRKFNLRKTEVCTQR